MSEYDERLRREQQERDASRRSDENLRSLADFILEATAVERFNRSNQDVEVVVGRRNIVMPWETLDEAARALGALPQLRGRR